MKTLQSVEPVKIAVAGVVLAAILFIAVNIISNKMFGAVRWDASEGQVYSFTDSTRPIFEAIDEPIIARVYFSSTLGEASPRHSLFFQRVRDLLEQYSAISGGMLKVEYHNPEPFSDTEDRAVGFGLQAIPLGNIGEVGYFGIAATNSTDDQEVIPFFNLERESFIEYDLTKMVFTLSNPDQRVVGLITTLPVEGGMTSQVPGMPGQPTPPWIIMDQLRDLFEVQTLDREIEKVPDDVDVLFLAQPAGLSEAATYAIDQFVLAGGRALVLVDPNSESANPQGGAGGVDLAGIRKLMTSWGVTIKDDTIIGDLATATRVNTSFAGRPVISDYVAWMGLDNNHVDSDDAITGDVKTLNFATAGSIESVENTSFLVHRLVWTSPDSMEISADKVLGLPDVVALFREFVSSGKERILAARITGPAITAFPSGLPAADEKSVGEDLSVEDDSEAAEEEAELVHLTNSVGEIQVVVVADSDIMADRFWVQESNFFGQRLLVPSADNAAFLINALENLTGSPALSSLRARGQTVRPFVLVEDIRRDAEFQYRSTEQQLLGRLEELQEQVADIQLLEEGAENSLLREEDKVAIEGYRAEILATRQELRAVQRALQQDIDRLEGWTKVINIAGVPIGFGLVLIGIAWAGRARQINSETSV